MFRKRKPKTVKLEFECKVCRHSFSQNVRRVFVDLNTMRKDEQERQEEETPYIIPQRVICPACGAVDQFELAGMSYLHLIGGIARVIGDMESADDPIQYIRFALHDGTPMHPHTALKMYSQKVAGQPDNVTLRLRYAATLRTLGYTDEAEAQYRTVLEQDPYNPEGLINLATAVGQKGDKNSSRALFQRLLDHPHWELDEYIDYAMVAQEYLHDMNRLKEVDWTHPAPAPIEAKLPPIVNPKRAARESRPKPERESRPKSYIVDRRRKPRKKSKKRR